MIKIPSPNQDSRDGQSIDMLVLHYTGMKNANAAIDKLIHPEAKVSAHYVVDELGKIFQLVPEEMRAWHAGKSYWRGHTNINQRSIGIEIVNPGHEFGYVPFPEIQMQSVRDLCKDILSRHDIPARNVVGHSDVAPTRKLDPGELFDWQWLAQHGIGVWAEGEWIVDSGQWTDKALSTAHCPLLTAYGYDTTDERAAIIAFQRHFRQGNIAGVWDAECANILQNLI